MKSHIKNQLLLPSLITSIFLMLAGPVRAQTFTTLHTFTGFGEGGNPQAGLILSNNILYGTAGYGSAGAGGVAALPGAEFSLSTDGTGFTNYMLGFSSLPSGLILSGSTLYGTAQSEASMLNAFPGTVFAFNTDGTGFRIVYSFPLPGQSHTGPSPVGGVILDGDTLYGTVSGNGTDGTVFAVNTNGTGFTNVYSFTGGSDGANPLAGLILTNNILYGTASQGGSSGYGTVFAVNTNGTGFTVLHSFTATLPALVSQNAFGNGTNNDGAYPVAGLVFSDNTLYGTASQGGSSGNGTVFAVSTTGTGFTVLHSFTATPSTNGESAFDGLTNSVQQRINLWNQ